MDREMGRGESLHPSNQCIGVQVRRTRKCFVSPGYVSVIICMDPDPFEQQAKYLRNLDFTVLSFSNYFLYLNTNLNVPTVSNKHQT